MKIHIGDRVRIVTANGCMAHIRDNPREGIVIRVINKKLYDGGYTEYKYAQIRLDNGTIVEKSAESRFWTECDGLPEYQE